MVAIYITIDQFDDFNIFTEVTEGRFERINFPEKMFCNSFSDYLYWWNSEKDQRVFDYSTVW
jgi:hypothetical protein